jgi:TonB family protein
LLAERTLNGLLFLSFLWKLLWLDMAFKLPLNRPIRCVDRNLMAAAERLRSGLLAIDSKGGVVYVKPTGYWQRIYLLWIFRNFRRVPRKVLNQRQQEFIESMCGPGSTRVPDAPDWTLLIGTVEDIRPPYTDTVAPVRETCTVRKQHDAAGPRKARHSKRPVAADLSLALGAGMLSVLIGAFAWLKPQAMPAVHLPMPHLPVSDLLVSQLRAALTSVSVQQPTLADRTVQSSTPEVAVERHAESDAPQTQPLQIGNSRLASASSRTTTVVKPDSSVAVKDSPIPKVPEPDRNASRDTGVVAATGEPEIQAAEAPRAQVSGPPQKLVYPIYPETSAHGRVTLKAIVGSDGKVRQVTVLSGSPALVAAAVRAVRQWRYRPYYREGRTLEVETNIAISFIDADVISISFPAATHIPDERLHQEAATHNLQAN